VAVRRSAVRVAAILILSLATWMFFDFQGMPLGAGSTLVVVLAWAIVVFIIMALVPGKRSSDSEAD
jgi:RsiW-degrading membrane proteinase PrsW (M82 family)